MTRAAALPLLAFALALAASGAARAAPDNESAAGAVTAHPHTGGATSPDASVRRPAAHYVGTGTGT